MKKIFLLFAVFSLLLAGCENPLMERILGNNNNDGEKPGVQSLVFYTVTFNSMGGSYVPSQRVAEGETAFIPENPVWSGYGFVHWCMDKELPDYEYEFDTPIYGNITLYAMWSSTIYTVTFDSRWGNYVGDQIIGKGGHLNEPPEQSRPTPAGLYLNMVYPAPEYLTITEWYDEDNNHWNFAHGIVNGNMTLYAKWSYEPIPLSGNDNDVEKAIAYLNNSNNTANGAHTLLVSEGVSIAPQTLTSNDLTIQGLGTGEKIIQYSGTADSSLFTISASGASLTLGNNITLRGIENGSASLVSISNGTLVMKEGSKITGHTSDDGGGVSVNGGTFTMSGGTISENTTYGYGGGVYISSGTFNMSGGTMSGNNAVNDDGGGVYISSGTFNMGGGEVSNNTATNGGGVFVSLNSTFNMDGGTISDNTATINGGGVNFWDGTFNMSGGAVVTNNNDVYLRGKQITVTGALTGNTPVATIMPASYTEDIQVVTLGEGVTGTTLAQASAKFAVKPNGNETDWYVDSAGKLAKPFDLYEEVAAFASATSDKTIFVPHDITMGANITIPANSGKTLTITSKIGGTYTISRGQQETTAANGLFIVPAGANLIFENIVIDGKKETYSGNTASLVRVNSGGTFTLGNGAVLQNNRASNGGCVYVNGGTFNMSGSAKVTDGNTASNGGGVYVNSGTFIMTGGEVSDNTASGTVSINGGGGVYVNGGTFNMTGGTVSGNTASGTSTTNGGGGVYVNGGTFNMSGSAKVTDGNTASNGGGVYVSTGTFMVGGTAKVSGNTTITGTTPNNVYLANNRYITLGTGDNAPTTDMSIYVRTASADGVIVNSGASANHVQYFHADEAGKLVELQGDRILVANITVKVNNGSTETYYSSLTSALDSITGAGTYTVSVDAKQTPASRSLSVSGTNITLIAGNPSVPVEIELPATNQGSLFTVNTGVTLTLDSGVTLRRNSGMGGNNAALVTVSGGVLNMKTGANITGNQNSTASDSGGVRLNSGTFNMEGGTISGVRGTSGGGVYVNGGTFTMSGGEISGNSVSGTGIRGGGVNVESSGIFIMDGGKISNNTASSTSGSSFLGVGVYNAGTFTMSDGEISGNSVSNANFSNFYGGGVYNEGTFTMTGGEISGNSVDLTSSGNASGGGVYVNYDSNFNMDGGTISGNTAASGGGVYVSGDGATYARGTFTMSGSAKVSGNTATNGGGVYVGYYSSFDMSDNAEVSGNTATGDGGGVYATGIFTMDDGTISNNTATNGGGGVYVSLNGTFVIVNGVVYGINEGDNSNTAANGAALHVDDDDDWSYGVAQRKNSSGTITEDLDTITDNTIRVANGALQ